MVFCDEMNSEHVRFKYWFDWVTRDGEVLPMGLVLSLPTRVEGHSEFLD